MPDINMKFLPEMSVRKLLTTKLSTRNLSGKQQQQQKMLRNKIKTNIIYFIYDSFKRV